MFQYSEAKLARDVIRIVREIRPSLTGRYDSDRQEIDFFEGQEKRNNIYLGNLYPQAKQVGFFERRRWLRSVIGQISGDLFLSADELMNSLKLRVRTPFEIELRKRISAIHGTDLEYSLEQTGELYLELVSDRENTVSTVGSGSLQRAGITLQEASLNARAALTRSTGADQWTLVEPGIWASSYADDFDFARLVASPPDVGMPFDSVPICYAPSHSVCLITDREDEEILRRISDLGDQDAEGQRHLSYLFWTRTTDGSWCEYRPPENSAAAEIVATQQLAEKNSQYDEQKFALERLLEERGEDIFVASFMIYQDESGPFTVCTYTLDIPSYLPRTDRIAVVDPHAADDNDFLGMLSWDEFVTALGPNVLEQMPDENPPRYMLLARMTPDQISRIKDRLVPID